MRHIFLCRSLDSCDKANPSMRLWIKIGAATFAFIPMFVLMFVLFFGGGLPESIAKPTYTVCAIFNFPALLILALLKTYHVGKPFEVLSLVVLLLLWSSFIAWFFWKIAEEFLGEGEPEFETNPEKAKFDWVGFQVRFVLGFIIGFLIGWRFVRYSTSKTMILISMIVSGLIVGLAYGLYRPNFWSR
jgi:hypothetical protein